jgi:acetyl-CoA carboxylase biotin carboxyl carrier protein
VADEVSHNLSPFHVPTIQALVRLMSRHDLSEIDLRQGDLRIRLRRGGTHPVAGTPVVPPAVAVAPPATAPVSPTPTSPESKPDAKPVHLIKSPTPGTFYRASSPDAEPFVKVGSRVEPTTVVCLIEAMKLFNEIQAECTGVITEVLVENQQPVEYGQALFKVELTG